MSPTGGAGNGPGRDTGIGSLFDVMPLPAGDGPARFAIALPGQTLLTNPLFPRAALPATGRLASGRGLGMAECRASCLGEAAELVSSCEWGDERLVTATQAEIGPAALGPERLNGFGDSQMRNRAAWNSGHAGFDWRPRPHRSRSAIDWLAAEDAFGGRPAFVPADFAFIGRRQAGDETAVAIGDSNGCAAGPDPQAAKLAAVLELVERDATARWWYGRRRRLPIDPSHAEGAAALTDWLGARARRTWLFDITTDLDIPVMAAISAEPDGRDVALGVACRLDGHAAAISALTELLQMEVSLNAARALGKAAGAWAIWRATVTLSTPPLEAVTREPSEGLVPSRRLGSAGSDLSTTLDACRRAGVDLWFVDMTRTAIGVPVFRALSAALCHYKPRFGRNRLLAADARDLSPAAIKATRPWLTV